MTKPSSRCEKCRAACGQRRICVVCEKRICSYCASDWKKLKRKACVGLCARTAYARLKSEARESTVRIPRRTFVFTNPFINQGDHPTKGSRYVYTPNSNHSECETAM